jgi:PAS domain S-box-containing protein
LADRAGRPPLADESQLEAMNRVLRIAVHHRNLLAPEAFQAIAEALGSSFPLDCLAVVVPEPGAKRLYAVSLAQGGRPLPPFGACFPDRVEETVLKSGVIKVVDDARAAVADEISVAWGFLAYVIVPIRLRRWGFESSPLANGDGDDAPIVGKLIAAFREAGRASPAPLDLLIHVAELFGETFERSLELTRARRLATILETSGDGMLAWDQDGKITDVNRSAARMTGATRESLLGRHIHDVLDLESVGRAARPALSEERAHACRTTLTPLVPETSQPSPIPVSVTMSSVVDDPLVAMHALIRDDSHLIAAERDAAIHLSRVRELEKELRAILDNAPLIIFRLDPETGALKYLNRHAERSLGVPMSEAMSTSNFLRVVHNDAQGVALFDAAVAKARVGELSPPYETRLRWANREITVRGTIYPLRDERHVVAIEGILADVSAEHAARARAVQADRLSSLGLLAASVAHEVNNPAAFMLLGLGNLGRMLHDLEARAGGGEDRIEAARELVGELRDAVERIIGIVRGLRVFARPPGEEVSASADVNDVVESALSLARGQIMERAKLVKGLADDMPRAAIDAGRLGQVIVNLLVNASQAIGKNAPDAKITVQTHATDDAETIEITVSDTGEGIPPENLARIWAPFFTTKAAETGTGLGLSISREIIESAGGGISVESLLEESDHAARGTTFRIRLPTTIRRTDTRSSEPDRGSKARTSVSVRRRVLIVDDDVALAQALLEEIGRYHDVEVLHGGQSVLEALSTRRFDAILCDLRMEGMSGEALYDVVRERHPSQARAFIFMSGIGFVPEVERFLVTSGRPFLHKPFAVSAALELIAS